MADELTPAEEQDLALFAALEQGQIYLSKQEVFAQDILDEAFLGTDNVDLRGPLAIKNVLTAVALVNWLDTDAVIRAVWATDANFPAKLGSMGIAPNDIDTLAAIFHRLTAENPPAANQAAMLARLAQEPPPMVGAAPANTYIGSYAQIALRMAWIVQNSRVATVQKNDLRKLAYDAAREQQPDLTAQLYAERVGLDMSGISGVRRRVAGIGGNFFKDMGRSISRLFKNPLAVFRQWGEDIGRGLILLDKPFQWVREHVPFFGYVLGGVGTAVLAELGRALEEHSISAFNEQRVVFIVGNHLQQAGQLLILVGGVLQLFPPLGTAIGGALVLIGTLAIIAGRTILQFQAMVRQERVANEEYQRRLRELERLRALQKQQALDALNATGQSVEPPAPVAAPQSGFALALAAVAGVFLLGR